MDYFAQAMALLGRGVTAAGALYTVWGLIQLGSAIITAAAAWISSITM